MPGAQKHVRQATAFEKLAPCNVADVTCFLAFFLWGCIDTHLSYCSVPKVGPPGVKIWRSMLLMTAAQPPAHPTADGSMLMFIFRLMSKLLGNQLSVFSLSEPKPVASLAHARFPSWPWVLGMDLTTVQISRPCC